MKKYTCDVPANNSVVSSRTRLGVSNCICLLPAGHDGFHITKNEKGLYVAYTDNINCECSKCANLDTDWICQKSYRIDQKSAEQKVNAT